MANTTTRSIDTLHARLDRLGNIAPSRVRVSPPVGTATERDLLESDQRGDRPCELVDGVLVEKALGYRESILALAIAGFLRAFVLPRSLGLVTGADGLMRLVPGLIRIPDVAFAAWERIPGGKVPDTPIPELVPDPALEVLSEGKTPGEIERKRRDDVDAGVRWMWGVDRRNRTVRVDHPDGSFQVLDESTTMDGAEVLPGFPRVLRDLFAELDRRG